MEVSPQPKCSICYNVSDAQTCPQCSQVFTSVIASLTKIPSNPFSSIDNLVFQGGGVKGAAYLGVLEQLNKESDGFLTRVKRVAGSSAGSIVALYLALNLDLNYMGKLVKEKYSNLDEGMGLVIKGENKKVTAKLVFLTAIQYFKILKKEVHDEKKSSEALRKIKKISTDIKGYYTNKLWGYQKFFFNTVVGDRSAEAFTSCILDLLGVSYIIKNAKKRIYEEESKLEEESRQPILEEALETESHVYLPLEKRTITSTTTIEKAEGRQIIIEESSTDLVIERSETNDTENATRVISSVRESQVITESSDRVMEPTPMAKSRVESSFFGKISNFVWGEKSKKIITEFDLSNENDRKLLHYALAELLIQIKDFQEDRIEFKYDKNKIGPKMDEDELADHLARNFNIPKNQSKKDPLGVFTGDTVKQKMIIEPIQTAFRPFEKEIKIGPNGPTFAQMAEAKVFKDLYVTAFNCATNRTEVFSAEHTPNVFVADAVRASMSIPGFFKPVHISQKVGETVGNRKIYFEKKNEVRNEDVLFMDGGILDNYPLWIFDDIKYLLPNITLNAGGQEARTQRFSIQNQKTLGFKLLDPETLERYTNPYINNNLGQMKRTNEASQATGNKWTFVGGTLLGSKMDQEENEFIKFGNCSRTVYVDNANVSPLAFDMDDEVVNRLIHNGEDSVKKFKDRFERHFLNEGQAYSAYSSR